LSLSPVIAVRLAGLLAGLSLVAGVAFGAWRVPASPRTAGLDAELRVVGTGEVGVAPAGAAVRGSGLVPGGPAARGRVRLTNQTAGALAVAPRVSGGDPALDRLVDVELRTAGSVVFRGSLERLRGGSGGAVATLRRGGQASFVVSVRVPSSAGEDAVAQAGRWTLTFVGAR
jgi:hypothetical protein